MMIKLAKIPNLTELTYRSIKQSLLNGTFGESSRLTEESLATQLGISKSPVREALNRLEAEGLVCIEARRGAYVRQFSPKEIRDLYDLRIALETHSIETATITPKLLRELSASINRTKKFLKNGEKLQHIEEDLRFHSTITAAGGNEELSRVLENIQQKSSFVAANRMSSPRRLRPWPISGSSMRWRRAISRRRRSPCRNISSLFVIACCLR